MGDCCEKIIKKIPVEGPTGPQGPPGGDPTRYFGSYEDIQLSDEGDPFVYTITTSGDYILQLNAHITRTDVTVITSYLIKNGVYQVSNVNGLHQHYELVDVTETTLTHNAKLTGVVAGDIIGFSLLSLLSPSYALVVNASLTILKLT